MCHSLSWKEWEVLADEEPRKEEPRVFADEPEPEVVEAEEAEPVRTPERERELIRA
jgi:hypothetical protein